MAWAEKDAILLKEREAQRLILRRGLEWARGGLL